MLRKVLLAAVFSVSCIVYPVMASVPGSTPQLNNLSQEERGAKRLTPVLDIVGEELEKIGLRLFDSAAYSMEELWQDTVNWNFIKKLKI